jgi:AcrR family transcriptional regulator
MPPRRADPRRPTREDTTSQSPDSSTRQRLIDAAVACIAEEGYYRASSNQIARRAGVTWGVIQHHFGTRERLLLEVAREGVTHLVATLEHARITGDSQFARLDSLADVVWSHYCRPEFLVGTQIVMNLTRDPATAQETIEALDEITTRTTEHWQHLVDQVLDRSEQPPGLSKSLFYILRGVAVGEQLLDSMINRGPDARPQRHRGERQFLLQALAAQLGLERWEPSG